MRMPYYNCKCLSNNRGFVIVAFIGMTDLIAVTVPFNTALMDWFLLSWLVSSDNVNGNTPLLHLKRVDQSFLNPLQC